MLTYALLALSIGIVLYGAYVFYKTRKGRATPGGGVGGGGGREPIEPTKDVK